MNNSLTKSCSRLPSNNSLDNIQFLLAIVPPDHLLLDRSPNIGLMDHSYLVGNLTNSKIAETKAVEPLKS
jgi:hypothetical protein